MKYRLLLSLKRWWFWLCAILVCAVPTGQLGGATGMHYDFGAPFPSLYVKHGSMGIGGILRDGFLFINDGSLPDLAGDRTGWFIHPELLGIALNTVLCLLLAYWITLLWQKARHGRQLG